MPSYTTRPEVLQMLGGALKMIPKSVFIEKKLASNSVALPIPDILKQVISQTAGEPPNLGALFQNPIATISTQLSTAATNAISQVTDVFEGGNAFTEALGDLQTAVTTISSLAGNLSGEAGGTGFAGMVAHANLAEMLTGAIPEEYGLDRVVQPLLHNDALAAMQTAVTTLTAQVLDDPMTVSDAADTIAGHVADLTAVVDASNGAVAGLQDLMEVVVSVNAAVGSVVGSTSAVAGNQLLSTVMQKVIPAPMLASITAAGAALFPPVPAFPEPVQPLED